MADAPAVPPIKAEVPYGCWPDSDFDLSSDEVYLITYYTIQLQYRAPLALYNLISQDTTETTIVADVHETPV